MSRAPRPRGRPPGGPGPRGGFGRSLRSLGHRSRGSVGRHLLLWGFMGAGKSRAGALAAAALGRPLIDLDREIERAAGLTVAQLFAIDGEPAFRALESALLRRALAGKVPAVIALGGGALIDPANFRAAAAHELRLIDIPLAEARRRIAADRGAARPLARELAARFRARRAAYARVRARVDGRGTPAHVAQRLLLARGGEARPLTARGLHPAALGLGATRDFLESIIAPAAAAPVLVTHRELLPALPAESRARLRVITVPSGERAKSAAGLGRLWRALARLAIDRATPVIGLGGGVIGDLAGFAAATWRRGVPFHFIPTTLTAMVDAGLGGKTAIDLPEGKNLAGLFAPPRSVLIDPAWLLTLPPREFASGWAELVKTAALSGEARLAALERDAPHIFAGELARLIPHLAAAARYKLELCRRDPLERGGRVLLNLGHTIAHQLEKERGYGALTHGEAVAIGLVAELRLAAECGALPARPALALAARLEFLLALAGLPTRLKGSAAATMNRALRADKKTMAGVLRWPLLRAPGDPLIAHWPRNI